MPDPRLSVSLPYWQDRDPMDALLVAEAADKLGYDRLWLGEMATFDAFALATAIGREPGTIPLCLGPLAVSIRTPATIAMGVASVAALTGRRVDVALGTSSTVVVRDWHGRERTSTAVHLEESVRIVRGLLDGEKVVYDGQVERINGFRLRITTAGADGLPVGAQPAFARADAASDVSPTHYDPDLRPVTPVPSIRGHAAEVRDRGRNVRSEVIVAAFGAKAMAAAARTADRVVLNLITPAQVARCVTRIKEFATRAGRPMPSISVWVTAAADPTPEMLLTLRRGVVGYLRAPGYDAMFEEAGFADVVRLAHSGAHPRDVLAAIPDELPAAVGMFGGRDTLADRLAAYRAAGADEVVIVPVSTAEDPAAHHTLETLARVHHE